MLQLRFAAISAVILYSGCAEKGAAGHGANSEVRHPLVAQSSLNFGYQAQGDTSRQLAVFRNESDKSISFEFCNSTCDCLQLEPTHGRVEPGKSVFLQLTLDLSHAAHFIGPLSIEVYCVNENQNKVVSFTVSAVVIPSDDLGELSARPGPTDRVPPVPDPKPMPEP